MHIFAAVFALVAIYCAWLNHRDGASIRASADKASNARLSNITRWHKGALILSLLGLAVALVSLILWLVFRRSIAPLTPRRSISLTASKE